MATVFEDEHTTNAQTVHICVYNNRHKGSIDSGVVYYVGVLVDI
jgi:hypothetical protein